MVGVKLLAGAVQHPKSKRIGGYGAPWTILHRWPHPAAIASDASSLYRRYQKASVQMGSAEAGHPSTITNLNGLWTATALSPDHLGAGETLTGPPSATRQRGQVTFEQTRIVGI